MTKRGLYPTLSKYDSRTANLRNMMDFLQYADGKNNLQDISLLLNVNKKKIFNIYNRLKELSLISI